MIDHRRIVRFLRDWLGFFFYICRSTLLSRQTLVIENLALRSQLAIYEQDVSAKKRPKHQPTPAFRQLWVILFRFCKHWQSLLIAVKSRDCDRLASHGIRVVYGSQIETKRTLASLPATIAAIKRIHKENPL